MVGENVRKRRIAAGLTQAALAVRMGVDRAYVSGLEQGKRNPTVVSLWHTAQALGVKVGVLLDEARAGRTRKAKKIQSSRVKG